METLFFVAAKFIAVVLSVVELAMLVRAVLSFSEELAQSKVSFFTYLITEPFIAPVRMVLYKLNIGVDSFFDIPFLVTCLLIMLLRMFLPVI